MVDAATAQNGASQWSAVSGALAQSSNIPTLAGEISKPGTYAQYQGGLTWTDYRVSLDLTSGDDDHIGLMFRVADDDNYYRFSWSRQASLRRLVKNVGGTFTVLAHDTLPYEIGQSYHLEMSTGRALLEVTIDGVLVFSVIDTALTEGTVGLYSFATRDSRFD